MEDADGSEDFNVDAVEDDSDDDTPAPPRNAIPMLPVLPLACSFVDFTCQQFVEVISCSFGVACLEDAGTSREAARLSAMTSFY